MPVTRSSRRQILKKPDPETEIPNKENKETKQKSKTRSNSSRDKLRPLLKNISNSKVKATEEEVTKKQKPKEKPGKVRSMRTLGGLEEAELAVEEVNSEMQMPPAEATIEADEKAAPAEEEKETSTAPLKRKGDEEDDAEMQETPDETAAVSPAKKAKQKIEEDNPKQETPQNIDIQTGGLDTTAPSQNIDIRKYAEKPLEPPSSSEKAAPPPEQCVSPKVAAPVDADKEQKPSTSLSLKAPTPQSSPATSAPGTRSLPEKLLSVLSNLYLNAAERLQLDFTPRCAENLSYCHQHHYRALLPEAPTHQQAQNLRCALQQQRYVSFVNLTRDICQRGEFPGEGIFTKLIELLLSINAKTYNNKSFSQTYNKSIELFGLIVRTFPPCWLALRPFYISFFQRPLDALKITPKHKPPLSKSTRIFEIILDLLENTLEQCSDAELHEQSFVDEAAAAPATSPRTPNATAAPAVNIETPSVDMSVCSEFYNQWEWEEREHNLQTFVALSPGCRLERLFVVLRLLLQILESDFVLWILHHHKTTKDWIFCEDNRPLVVVVFEMSKYTRFSGVVRRVFTLFSSAVSKDLSRARLQIIERYIALLMVASNTADMENTVIGVKYPYLGAQTKSLIREFFKIFKAHNTAAISTYIQTIDLLRIPYVRYEFIDHFLQLFYFAHTEEMTPKKICYDMAKKRWLKYKPQAELTTANDDEDLSREQYLRVLLNALRVYCEWHGSKTFLQLITVNDARDSKQLKPIQTSTDSVHRWPTRGAGALVLEKMATDMSKLEQLLKLTVRMSMPKVDLPIADICIDDEIITKYRNDLKFVMILHDMLPKHAVAHPEVDFTEWQVFLSDFAPRS